MKIRNIRNIISISIIAFLLVLLAGFEAVFAATVKVEGEKYSSMSINPVMRSRAEFSGNTIVEYLREPEGDKEHYIEYKVDVPKDGAYQVNVVSTLLASAYTADYYVQANGGETIDAGMEYTIISKVTSSTYPDTIEKYNLGTLGLKKGENIIRFIINTADIRSDKLIAFFIDYFELVEVPFGIKRLENCEALNVYEESQKVSFNVLFNTTVPEQKKFRFVIKDFWSAVVLEDEFLVRGGVSEYLLNFGRFQRGWYTIEVFEDDNKLAYNTFSVVVPKKERAKLDDSPFAVDFASSQLVRGGKENVENYIRAAELAGFTWVRERYHWITLEPSDGNYKFEVSDADLKPFEDSSLKIVNAFHGTPSWAREKVKDLPTNLFHAYEIHKELATRYKDIVDTWEVWNEEDTIFCSEPADFYASFMKASAIGVSDANVGASTVVGGFASRPTHSAYIDLALQNDVMSYSDAYNYHYHLADTGDDVTQYTPKTDFRSLIADAYDRQNQPVWVTEAGMYMPVATGGSPSRGQLLEQARYLVTSTAQSLSLGTTRHFWFVLPSYVEEGRELGTFYASGNPYPCYSAEATLTDVLGRGEYIGELDNLPDFAEGYMFDNGKNDVAVVWSEHGDKATLKTNSPVSLVDIMGKEKVISPVNGEVTVDISHYPVYIVFDGKSSEENYYPQKFIIGKNETHTFDTAERIVLQQYFGNEEVQAPKLQGYQLKFNKATEMTLNVYNFNDSEQTATIRAISPKGVVITPAEVSIPVAAMSMEPVIFTIKYTEEADPNVTNFLKFEGEVAGNSISPSVSRIFAYKEVETDNVTYFEGSDNPAKWDGSNIVETADPAVITAGTTPGTVMFDLKFNGGNRWFYPFFYIDDPTVLRGSTGVCFRIYAEEELQDISLNFFAYFKDGRQYYLGHSKGKQVKAGWNQIAIPWDHLELFLSPYGNLDFRDFDTDLISHVSIGCNSNRYDDVEPYQIKEFGFYTEEKKSAEETDIIIKGIEEKGVYKAADLEAIEVSIPAGEYTGIFVEVNDNDYENITINGNKLVMDMTSLSKGSYMIQVCAQSESNFVLRKVVNIYID
ncbi:MAG: hypothetical protein KIG65_06950 [Eubacteriales bacterium]|nr:hypothetical protein [Eubacteriales bacterium]